LNALAVTTFYLNAPDFNRVENLKLRCVNFGELVKSGVRDLPFEGIFEFHTHYTVEPGTLDVLLRQYQSLVSQPRFGEIHRIATLFRVARENRDEFIRFDFLWKSFNAFYDLVCDEQGQDPDSISQTKKISQWVDKIISCGQATNLMSTLGKPLPKEAMNLILILSSDKSKTIVEAFIKRNLTTNRGKNCSASLNDAMIKKDDINALKFLLECLYVVRCKVMHGDIYAEEERNFAYLCSCVLEDVLGQGLNEYLSPIVTK
jgi:hypothetical protein